MRVFEEKRGLLVRFETGEKIVESITKLAAEREVRGAALAGVGALSHVELGYYVLPEKRYERTLLEADHELISLLGNVTLKDGRPFVHVHATLGARDYKVYGGHLFEGVVGASVELRVEKWNIGPVREADAPTGLALWNGCEYYDQ